MENSVEVYSAQNRDDRVLAEEFFYHSPHSCLGRFVYPNQQSIQGIGLHSHPTCWDIEIVIAGRGFRMVGDGKLEALKPGTLLLNPPGIAHSMLAEKNQELLVYGYRCPPEYTGDVLLPELLCPEGLADVICVGDGSATELRTWNLGIVKVQSLGGSGARTIAAGALGEKTMIVLGGAVQIAGGESLKMGDAVRWEGLGGVALEMQQAQIVIFEPLVM